MSCSPFFPSVLGSLLFCATSFAAMPALPDPRSPTNAAESSPITTVAAAFARWPELETNEEPVRIEGVVTGTMPNGAFRLHDGELGIYVTKSPAGQDLTPGDRVAVSGV